MRRTPNVLLKLAAICVVLAALIASSAAADRPGLSQDERDKLKSIIMQTRDKAQRERNVIRRARQKLFETYTSYDLNERDIKSALNDISQSQLRLLQLHMDSQIAIRKVLSRDEFQQIRDNLKRKHEPGTFLIPRDEALLDKFPDSDTIARMNLPPAQRRRLASAVAPSPERQKVVDKLRKDSKQLMEEFSQYDLDTGAARKLIANIHDSQVDLAALNHKKQQAIRRILNENQFQQLRTELMNKLHEMRRNHDGRNQMRK